MKQALGIVCATALLCGCVNQSSQVALAPKQGVIAPGATIYVVIPEPGRDSSRSYPESGFQTAQALATALSAHAKSTVGRQPESVKTAIDSARQARCDYVIRPEIREWEDNPTEWTGERDRLAIDVETIDVKTGATIGRVVLNGRGKWATTGNKPNEMLNDVIGPFVAGLFRSSP